MNKDNIYVDRTHAYNRWRNLFENKIDLHDYQVREICNICEHSDKYCETLGSYGTEYNCHTHSYPFIMTVEERLQFNLKINILIMLAKMMVKGYSITYDGHSQHVVETFKITETEIKNSVFDIEKLITLRLQSFIEIKYALNEHFNYRNTIVREVTKDGDIIFEVHWVPELDDEDEYDYLQHLREEEE